MSEANNKARILFLEHYLNEHTDEQHMLALLAMLQVIYFTAECASFFCWYDSLHTYDSHRCKARLAGVVFPAAPALAGQHDFL